MKAMVSAASEGAQAAVPATPHDELARIARRMIAARRALDGCLPRTFIPDPSIDMLMTLYLAARGAQPVPMAALEAATTVTPTVAYRWLAALATEGYVALAAGTATLTGCGVARVEVALRAVIESQRDIA